MGKPNSHALLDWQPIVGLVNSIDYDKYIVNADTDQKERHKVVHTCKLSP